MTDDFDFDNTRYISSGPHRTACDAIQESRQIVKKLSFWNVRIAKPALGLLIEEIQSLANRMEAGLYYGNDLSYLHKRRKELIKEVKTLEKKQKELKKKNLDELAAEGQAIEKEKNTITRVSTPYDYHHAMLDPYDGDVL